MEEILRLHKADENKKYEFIKLAFQMKIPEIETIQSLKEAVKNYSQLKDMG